MKRKEFLRELIKEGCFLSRHGSRHDLYVNPRTGKKAPVPRHPEIKETLCRIIRNQLHLPKK